MFCLSSSCCWVYVTFCFIVVFLLDVKLILKLLVADRE